MTTIPRCPVCSDALHGATVRCDACETAYHPDCWRFTGTCAIYGCQPRPSTPEPKADAAAALTPDARSRGTRFGATLGLGVALLAWVGYCGAFKAHLHGPELLLSGLAWATCAAILGGYTGATVRGRTDRIRTLAVGLIGPACVAMLLTLLVAGVCYLPFYFVFSLPAVVFAIPCAILAERFNDSRFFEPGRQSAWMTAANLLVLAGIVVSLAAAALLP